MCDEILRQAVEGVSDIITTPGDINTDFNDIKAIMEGAGPALMGIGIAEGDERAKEAAKQAVNSPLLDVSISGAKGILFVVAGSDNLGIMEVQDAAKVIGESVDKNARIIFGIMNDTKLKKGQIRIIVIATGFPEGAAHTSHSGIERSLFAMPMEKREEERGRIYHEILKREEKPEGKIEKSVLVESTKEEPIVTATPHKPRRHSVSSGRRRDLGCDSGISPQTQERKVIECNDVRPSSLLAAGLPGVAAGVYAARKRLKTLLITEEIGGQSVVSDGIENWIGSPKVSGADLAKLFSTHLDAVKGDIVTLALHERVESLTSVGGETASSLAVSPPKQSPAKNLLRKQF